MSTPPITLYTGSPSPGTYSWSPFSIKLEARLRFSHLAYTVVPGASPRGGPRGKIPYARIPSEFSPQGGQAVDGAKGEGGEGVGVRRRGGSGAQKIVEGERGVEGEGEMVSDSAMIIKMLVERGWLEDLNKGLGDVQRAGDVLITALVEERIYFLGVRVISLLCVSCSEREVRSWTGRGIHVCRRSRCCGGEGCIYESCLGARVLSSVAIRENVWYWARVCEFSC